MYGMKQAAQRLHVLISEWMEQHGCPAMNSESADFIIHGLFVDDLKHVPSCDRFRDEFLELYKKDFEITGGGLMETFLGMEVDKPNKVIRLHLDSY